MFSSEDVYMALNVASITALLDDYEASTTVNALFDGHIIPQDFTGTESINFYMSGVFLGGIEWEEYRYSINCRSATDMGSRTMAKAVIDGINRVHYDDYFIVCSVLQTIPPMDKTDVYNTPVEATIKKR
jgi:hypothetical protein